MANTFSKNVIRVDTAGLVRTGAASISGILLKAGADAATVTVYDALTATNPIAELGQVAANGWDAITGLEINIQTGIYVALTGTSPIAYVYLR